MAIDFNHHVDVHVHVDPLEVRLVGERPRLQLASIGLERRRDTVAIGGTQMVSIAMHDFGVIGVGYDGPKDADGNPLPLDGPPTFAIDDGTIVTAVSPSTDPNVEGSAFTLDIATIPGPGGVGATVVHVSASFNGQPATDDIAVAVSLGEAVGGMTANVGAERTRPDLPQP